MNKTALLRFVAPCALLSASLSALAFDYQPGDVLLVFRKDGFNDVEFDLGPVGQFLSQPAGTTATVLNWNLPLVQAQYALTDGVRFAVLASTDRSATNPTAWLSDAGTANPKEVTPTGWQLLWSKISGVGDDANAGDPNTATNAFVAPPASVHSYTTVASNDGVQPGAIPTLGGSAAFTVESAVPGKLHFYEIKPVSAASKPLATLTGSFQLDAAGNLTYHAGPDATTPQPVTISSISWAAGAVSVAFPSVQGVRYRLRYADQLGGNPTNWTAGSAVLVGTGAPATLADASVTAADVSRFYVVESFQ